MTLLLTTVSLFLLVALMSASRTRTAGLHAFDSATVLPLRGVLAMLIVLHHIALNLSTFGHAPVICEFEVWGAYIVAVFFFLSGYGLTLSYLKKGPASLSGFLSRRFGKLLPPYLGCGAVFVALSLLLFRDYDITAQLRKDLPDVTNVFLPTSWFIVAILLLYALFYAVMKAVTAADAKGERKKAGKESLEGFGKENPKEEGFGKERFGKENPKEGSFGKERFGTENPKEGSFGKERFGTESLKEGSFGKEGFGTENPKERIFGKERFGKENSKERSFGKERFGTESLKEAVRNRRAMKRGMLLMGVGSVIYTVLLMLLGFQPWWYISVFAFNTGTLFAYHEPRLRALFARRPALGIGLLLGLFLVLYAALPREALPGFESVRVLNGLYIVLLEYVQYALFPLFLVFPLYVTGFPKPAFLCFLGGLSMEIYLVQGALCRILAEYGLHEHQPVLYAVGVLALSIACGWGVKHFSHRR